MPPRLPVMVIAAALAAALSGCTSGVTAFGVPIPAQPTLPALTDKLIARVRALS